jgi:hypothetical protein
MLAAKGWVVEGRQVETAIRDPWRINVMEIRRDN